MTVLRGDNVGPEILNSKLAQLDIMSSRRKAAKESLERELQEWEALKGTKLYHILNDLCGPRIAQLQSELAKSILDYAGWPVEVLS